MERQAAAVLPPRPPKGGEGRGEEGRADPRALKQQGDALARESRFAEAAAVYRQALALAPDFVEVHNNLGNVLKFLGREEEAIACYRRALELRPAMVDALNNLGVCLAEKDEAAGLPYFRRVLELNPGSAAAHANLAVNLTKAGRFEGVPALFRRAIKLDPNLLEARVGLATCLAQQGAPEDAAAELRAALAIDPDFLPAYFTLAELPGDRLTAEDHARLRSVSARKDLRPEHRAPLLFLLAAREERAGRHAAAFELASRANALERRRLGFSAEAEADFIRRTMAVFDDSFFRENRVRGSESELPVFVVGLPRSGTTLIEQIIASHPKAAGAGEVIEIGRIANGLQAALGADAPFPGCAARLGQEKARELAEAYLKHLVRHGPGAARVVDKMSSNFRLLGLIALLLPRARIIHCRRDPRDTAVSCFFLHFHKPMGFAYDLRDFAAYYRGYEALMAHWHRVLPMPILDVQYEELVAAPEPKIRQMLEFCGLEWDERCLSFQSNGRAVRTASMWQVRRPLYASSIGRWRRYEKQLAPLLEALGHHTPSCQASGLASTSSPAETNDRCVRPEADRLVDARAKHEHDGGVLPGEGAPGRPLHELAPGAPSPQPSPPVGERGLDGSVGERGRALRGEGGDPRALKRRADSLARESRFAEAEALYRRALALAPDLAEAHNNLGNVLTYLGRGEEAAGCYRQALRHKPGLVDAHNNLGAWLAQRDLPEAAAHHFREVLKAEPAHAEAQLNLAKLLVKLGDRSAAAEHFRRAAGSPRATSEVQLQSGIGLTACRLPEEAAALLAGLIGREPLNAAAYRALATALADQGKLDEALAQARQAVEIEPRNGLSHAELALLLKAEGRAMDARFHARLAVELGPQLARAHLVSASLLESLGETQAAAKAYREAIRLAPDQPEAHSSLGVLLMNAGHAGAALKALRRAAELAPRDPSVLNNLGIGLQESGSYDEARAVFAKALEIEPQFAEALCNLAMIEQQLGRIAEARALYRRAHELKPALPGAILGLVQLSERKAEAVPAEAMESVLAGAALDGAGRSVLHFALARTYDEAGEFGRAFEHATKAHALAPLPKSDAPSPAAVARKIMEIFDSQFFADRVGFGRRSEVPVFVFGLPRSGTTLVEQILASHPRIFGAGELPDIPRLSARLQKLSRASEPYPAGIRQLDEPFCLRLAGSYLNTLRRLDPKAARVIDKMPFNFWYLGFIALMFPKARFINCRRNPLDVFVSGYFMRFRYPIRHAADQARFAEFYAAYAEVMEHWRQVLPNPILDVDYEALVARQEPVSREMVAFCGLPWDEACLAFYDNPRPIRTASAAQVRRGIYPDSIGRWRHYEAQLQPLIASLTERGRLPPRDAAALAAAIAK